MGDHQSMAHRKKVRRNEIPEEVYRRKARRLSYRSSASQARPEQQNADYILYLGPEEELTSVRERLEETNAGRIMLVIPPVTQLRSHVGWRLLHARMRELGKDVLVISSERQIRAVAKAAGFSVADSRESPPSARMRPSSHPSRSGTGGRTPQRSRNLPGKGSPENRAQRQRRQPNQPRVAADDQQQTQPMQRETSSGASRTDEMLSGSATGAASPSDLHIDTSPFIHPRVPGQVDDELDTLAADFYRAQSIREAAQGMGAGTVSPAPGTREPSSGIPRQESKTSLPAGHEDDPFAYMEDLQPPSLPEQRGSAHIGDIDSGVPDIADVLTDVHEMEIEDLGDEEEVMLRQDFSPYPWSEPVMEELGRTEMPQVYGSPPRSSRMRNTAWPRVEDLGDEDELLLIPAKHVTPSSPARPSGVSTSPSASEQMLKESGIQDDLWIPKRVNGGLRHLRRVGRGKNRHYEFQGQLDGEVVKIVCRKHWWFLVSPAFPVIGSIAIVILFWTAPGLPEFHVIWTLLETAAAVSSVLFGIRFLFREFIPWWYEFCIITNKRIVNWRGFSHPAQQISIEKVQQVALDRNSPHGPLLSYGSIHFYLPGGVIVMKDVPNPEVVVDAILRIRAETEAKKPPMSSNPAMTASLPRLVESKDISKLLDADVKYPVDSQKSASNTQKSTQVTSTSSQGRRIPERLKRVDNGKISRHLKFLRDNCRTLSLNEMHTLLDPAEVRATAEAQFTKIVGVLRICRNSLAMLLLIVTWLSLELAGIAYIQSLQTNPKLVVVPFLEQWMDGFPAISSISINSVQIPLTVSGVRFTFGQFVLLDTITLSILLVLTIVIQVTEFRAHQEAMKLSSWLKEELYILGKESVISPARASVESKQLQWNREVQNAINHFSSVLTGFASRIDQLDIIPQREKKRDWEQNEERIQEQMIIPQPYMRTDSSDTLSPNEKSQLSLFALAHALLEEDDRAVVGKTYSIQTGISQHEVKGIVISSFQITVRDPAEPIPFDIMVHPGEHVELIGDWYQRLLYDPTDPNPQLTTFRFRVSKPGQSQLFINFYRERQWLKTIHLEFDVVEQLVHSESRG